jgi:hypothetical protein
VERSNGMILQGLKPRIYDGLKPYAGKWIKELPSVLWALRTTLSRATGHTLFSLVYGSESMLPTEVEHKSFHNISVKSSRMTLEAAVIQLAVDVSYAALQAHRIVNVALH